MVAPPEDVASGTTLGADHPSIGIARGLDPNVGSDAAQGPSACSAHRHQSTRFAPSCKPACALFAAVVQPTAIYPSLSEPECATGGCDGSAWLVCLLKVKSHPGKAHVMIGPWARASAPLGAWRMCTITLMSHMQGSILSCVVFCIQAYPHVNVTIYMYLQRSAAALLLAERTTDVSKLSVRQHDGANSNHNSNVAVADELLTWH